MNVSPHGNPPERGTRVIQMKQATYENRQHIRWFLHRYEYHRGPSNMLPLMEAQSIAGTCYPDENPKVLLPVLSRLHYPD